MTFSAFTYRHFVLALLLGLLLAIHMLAPRVAFELDLVLALAAVMAPAVAALSNMLGGRHGLAVTLITLCVVTILGLFAVFVLPAAVKSLKDMLLGLKDQMPALRQYIEEWIVKLGMVDVGIDIDDTFGKIWEILQKEGMSGAAAAMVGKVSLGLLVGAGQIFIGFVVLAILAASWDVTMAWTRSLIRDVAPGQAERVFRIAAAAQVNGIAMVRGLGIMSLIFTVSYFVILAVVGLPVGKTLVLGATLGLLSALPAVGGFISATLSLLIGIAHWGALGWQTWFLYGSGIAAHFIETKFLTPRIVGHAIDVPPFVMIGALLSGIAMNGAAGGFQALILLPILRAMIDDLSADHAAVPGAIAPQAVSADARPPAGQAGKPQNPNKKKMRG